MGVEFPYLIYYIGLLIAVLLLSRFIFRKYIQFAKKYSLKKAHNERTVHKGSALTGR